MPRLVKPRAMPLSVSSRPLMASVGPFALLSQSKKARMSLMRFFMVRPRTESSGQPLQAPCARRSGPFAGSARISSAFSLCLSVRGDSVFSSILPHR